jgi:tryptophan synthase alpha subunit
MSYYNILFRFGVAQFAETLASAGLHGAIVPDLPHEEGAEYLEAMARASLAPIFIYSPNTSDARMRAIALHARGFVYCVARKGVTGAEAPARRSSRPPNRCVRMRDILRGTLSVPVVAPCTAPTPVARRTACRRR